MAVDIETIGVGFDTTGLSAGTAAFNANEAAAVRAAAAADLVSERSKELARQNAQMGQAMQVAKTHTESLTGSKIKYSKSELDAADAADRFMNKLQQEASVVGKTRLEILQLQAAQHGLTEAADPMIRKIAEANGWLATTGMTARAQAASLRGVPAQFTDIFTSIQAGQAPMTVLLQQGGQLKDMFGGIGPAARAMGGYIMGMVTPITVAAAALGGLGYLYFKGQAESDKFNKTIALTGGFAGITAGQFDLMADRMATASNKGIRGTKDALSEMMETGRFTGTVIESLGKTVMTHASLSGKKMEEIAKDYAKMPDGVAKWAEEHNKSMHFMSLAQYEHIRLLEEQGKKQEAMLAVGKALDAQLATGKSNLGYLETAWRGLGNAASWAWDKMLNVGRTATLEDKLNDAAARVENARKRLEAAGRAGMLAGGTGAQTELDNALGAQSALQSDAIQSRRAAAAKAEQARIQEAGIAAANFNRNALAQYDKQFSMKQKLAEQQRMFDDQAAAGMAVSKRDQEVILNGIRKQYESKTKLVDKDAELIASVRASLAAGQAEAEQGTKLTPVQREIAELNARITNGKIKYKDTTLELVRALMQEKLVTESWNIAQEKHRKNLVEIDKLRDKELSTLQKETKTLEEAIGKQSDHNEAIGQSKSVMASLIAQRELDKASALEGVAIKRLEKDADWGIYEATMKKVEAMRTLVAEQARGDKLQTMVDEAKKASEAWKDFYSDLYEGITDSLYRATEKGETFFQSLWSGVKNLFRTQALKLTIQAGVSGGMSMLGIDGNSQSGGMGIMDMAKIGNSAYNFATGNSLSSVVGGYAASASYAAAVPGLTSMGAGSQAAMLAAQTAEFGVAGLSATAAAGGAGAVMTGLMAVAPYLGVAMLAYSLFSGKGGGPKVDGAAGRGALIGSGAMDASVSGVVSGVQAQYESYNKMFGGSGGIQFGMGVSTDPKGDSPTFVDAGAFKGDQRVFYDINRNVGRSEEDVSKATAAMAVSSLIKGMQNSDLPTKWAEYFGSIADDATLEVKQAALETAVAVKAYTNQFAMFGGVFGKLEDLSVSAREALLKVGGGLEALTSKTASYMEHYYSEQERSAILAAQVTKEMTKLGYATTDTVPEFRALVDSIDLNSAAGRTLFASLMDLEGAFFEVNGEAKDAKTAIDKAKDALAGAMGVLERSVGAEKDRIEADYVRNLAAAQDRVDKIGDSVQRLTSLSTSLSSALSRFRTDQTLGVSQGEASAQIRTALAIAKAGGVLPDADTLTDALNIINQPSQQLYASFTDYAKAFDEQVQDITDLNSIAGDQLSAEKKMLALAEKQVTAIEESYKAEVQRLDDVLTQAKLQVDAINGVDISVKSVYQALLNFNTVLAGASKATGIPTTPVGQGFAPGTGGGSVVGGQITESGSALIAANQQANTIAQTYLNLLGRPPESASVYDYYAGWTPGQLEAAIKASPEGKAKGYANGGLMRNGFVGETGTEYADFETPARIYTNEQTRGMFDTTAADRVVDVLERVETILKAVKDNTGDTAKSTDRVDVLLNNVATGSVWFATKEVTS